MAHDNHSKSFEQPARGPVISQGACFPYRPIVQGEPYGPLTGETWQFASMREEGNADQ